MLAAASIRRWRSAARRCCQLLGSPPPEGGWVARARSDPACEGTRPRGSHAAAPTRSLQRAPQAAASDAPLRRSCSRVPAAHRSMDLEGQSASNRTRAASAQYSGSRQIVQLRAGPGSSLTDHSMRATTQESVTRPHHNILGHANDPLLLPGRALVDCGLICAPASAALRAPAGTGRCNHFASSASCCGRTHGPSRRPSALLRPWLSSPTQRRPAHRTLHGSLKPAPTARPTYRSVGRASQRCGTRRRAHIDPRRHSPPFPDCSSPTRPPSGWAWAGCAL